MIKRKQIFFHNPENGRYGDCHRTCIACLLDLEPAEVPNFGEHYEDGEAFNAAVDGYLASQFLAQSMHAFEGTFEEIMKMQSILNKDIYYILGGQSKNGTNHSVVCLGGEIAWDPAIDDSGIIGPMTDGYFWITYLVPAFATGKGI